MLFLGSVIISDLVHGYAIVLFSRSCYRSPLRHRLRSPRQLEQVLLVYYLLSCRLHLFQCSYMYCDLNFLTEDRLQIFFRGLTAVQYCVVTTTLVVVQCTIFCPSAKNLFSFSKTFPRPVLDTTFVVVQCTIFCPSAENLLFFSKTFPRPLLDSCCD